LRKIGKKLILLVTYLTFPLIYPLIGIFIYFFGMKDMATLILGVWTLDLTINIALKYAIRRKRPEPREDIPIMVYDYSFPSWHTESSFAVLISISAYLPPYLSFFVGWIPLIIAYNRL